MAEIPGVFHRLGGRADYRGWALVIDTDPEPWNRQGHMGKRWFMGETLAYCLFMWCAHRLRLTPPTYQGEWVTRVGITFIRGDGPHAL